MQTTIIQPLTNHPTGFTSKKALFQEKIPARHFASTPKFGGVPQNTLIQAPKDTVGIDGLSAEESETLKKEMEAQQKQAESLIKGLDKAIDVVINGNQWLKSFKASPVIKDENIFDRLSSLYHLTAGRFREYSPKKQIVEPQTDTNLVEKPNQKEPVEGTANPNSQPPSEKKLAPKPNAEAFEHYRQILSKYPDIALKTNEDLPFDLGQKTALTSQNPKQMLTLLQNKRNEFKKIQDRIQAEAKQKQQKQELTEDAVPAFVDESLKKDVAYGTMLQQIQEQFVQGKQPQ